MPNLTRIDWETFRRDHRKSAEQIQVEAEYLEMSPEDLLNSKDWNKDYYDHEWDLALLRRKWGAAPLWEKALSPLIIVFGSVLLLSIPVSLAYAIYWYVKAIVG